LNTDLVNTFEFDLFQAGILLNPAIINGGTITASIVPGSSQLVTQQQPTNVTFTASQNCIKLAPGGVAAHGTASIIPTTAPGIRIARIRLTNTVAFGQVHPNLSFNFTTSPYNTILTVYDQTAPYTGVNITNSINFTTTTMTNPIFNAPVLTFNVTGGGSYCSGGSGVVVGLSGSQAGVYYQLIKNAVPLGSYVAGTGSAISFGLQPAGNYTANGYRHGTYLTPVMTGSTVVTANPVHPVSITIAAATNPVCTGTPVNFSSTPVNGGSTPSYQWKVNGINAGTNSPSFSYTPSNSDAVTCLLTSNISCPTGNPANSDTVTMVVSLPVGVAGSITGSSSFTPGTSGVGYSISPLTNAVTYIWSYSGTGVTINGTGTSVTLDFSMSATPGQLSVNGHNTCGDGTPSTLNLISQTELDLTSVMLEGLYNGGGTLNQAYDDMGPHWPAGVADHITVELHSAAGYGTIVYTASDVSLSTTGSATVMVPAAYKDSYYITVKHRNSLETVSANAVSFAPSVVSQSFGTPTDVYGGNLLQMIDMGYAIYTGDPSQDGLVDSSDMMLVENQSTLSATGYLPEDINGDGLVDSSDMGILENNSTLTASIVVPM